MSLDVHGANHRAYLVLEDGTVLAGRAFGADRTAVGEVVFTTSVVGYPQSITDPSYRGQILVFTHPLIGNYGVSEDQFESDRVQVEAVVVYEATQPNHYKSTMSLDEWLKSAGVPGIARVDTRYLVLKLREYGVMMGAVGQEPPEELLERIRRSPRYDEVDYASMVSPKEPQTLGDGKICIGVVDCGVKTSILRELVKRGVKVLRVPCFQWELALQCDGVLFSPGPGNPKLLRRVSEGARAAAEMKKPILGICLGHQVTALALGADIYKLKFGHRATNKPVRDLAFTGKTYITTHNHGFAVDPKSLEGTGLRVWAVQPDDGTIEGLYHESLPVLTSQFHPEAGPGPWDTRWLFDKFLKIVEKYAEGTYR